MHYECHDLQINEPCMSNEEDKSCKQSVKTTVFTLSVVLWDAL